jgi:pantoate--beta-alanine ligase
MGQIKIARSAVDLRAALGQLRSRGGKLALVPTMGALHPGHLALVEAARSRARACAVSIFVNPKQFGPGEDLASYPRNEAGDIAQCAERGADLVYVPRLKDFYPAGFASTVSVGGVAEGLCAAFRPQMFSGVATVLTKLFLQVMPNVAVFGEKDYQQLLVIRRLVRDLDFPIEIVGVATVREADGLACSSRNAYLTAPERTIAPELYRTLTSAASYLRQGALAKDVLPAAARALIDRGFTAVDYVELRDAETLAPLATVDRPARLLAAAWLGRARLIDNVPVEPSGSGIG